MPQGTIKKVIADKGFGFIEGERAARADCNPVSATVIPSTACRISG
mgnify:CR=1 FL=1